MTSRLNDAMKTAVNEMVNDPVTHARLNRASEALIAVAAVEDPNPIRAAGHIFGTAVEYMTRLGFTRDFILEFATSILDALESEEGEKLREAAKKHQG